MPPTNHSATNRRTGAALSGAALLALALLLCAPAQAGQIRESDLVVSSSVGKVVNTAQGDKVSAKTQVHTLEIKRGSQTGEVHISGQVGRVTNQAGGQNVSADSAVGGVNVGGNK